MGVRRGDMALKAELERILLRRRRDMDAILAEYQVPRLDLTGAAALQLRGGELNRARAAVELNLARAAGANALVGPPLTSFSRRSYIAGHLSNNPDLLIRWIRHPHGFKQETAMPEMGVGEQDARDIAAYLYTLK